MIDKSALPTAGCARRRTVLKYAAGAVGAVGLSGCLGEEEDDDYPARDITINVATGAGGSFDVNARALAEFLPEHLPNDVDVIVENNPPPLEGLTAVYNADADGYTLGSAPVLGQVARELVQDVAYEMREMTWSARLDQAEYIMAAAPEYENISDLQEADSITFGTPGVGTTAWLSLMLASNILDIDYNFVNFDGNAEASTALRGGEVDGLLGTWTAPPVRDPIQDGEMNAVLTFTEEPPEYLPDVETAADLGEEDLLELNLMWPIYAPPGLDGEHREILEDAILDTVQTDEFVNSIEGRELPFNHTPGSELEEAVDSAFELFAEYEELLAEEMS